MKPRDCGTLASGERINFVSAGAVYTDALARQALQPQLRFQGGRGLL